jgi:hypothetical protein
MELMTAKEFENYLEDFEIDQKHTIKEDILELSDLLVWHLFLESARN